MDQELHDRAAARLETALGDASAFDPRGPYRTALRALKESRPEAFREALRYYEEVLLPQVAAERDPLEAWLSYGRRIAELSGGGRYVAVDPSGRALDGSDERDPDSLLLYLPDQATAATILLAGPAELSDAQQATVDLLVLGRLGR